MIAGLVLEDGAEWLDRRREEGDEPRFSLPTSDLVGGKPDGTVGPSHQTPGTSR
jgi:hypothetical protein